MRGCERPERAAPAAAPDTGAAQSACGSEQDERPLAPATAAHRPRLLLNHGDSFAIFDLAGDVPPASRDAYGLFHRGTRHLDQLELRLNGDFPTLLSSSLSEDESELVIYLCNSDERREGMVVWERETIGVARGRALAGGVLYERLQLHNYGMTCAEVQLDILFGADFADLFELRGIRRTRRGTRHAPQVGSASVTFCYQGLDARTRRTVVALSPAPLQLDGARATYRIELPPNAEALVELTVTCLSDERQRPPLSYGSAVQRVREERLSWRGEFPELYSNNETFNDLLNRSIRDLALLRARGPWGSYVYAGIPWFATLFGRDGLITALSTLAFAPALAAATLRALAALQGKHCDQAREEEPGKIVHEVRLGELAAIGEVPFERYYGSVDSTPLFVVLLGEYYRRSADIDLVRDLWDAALAAIAWIEQYGDVDGDGFVEYSRKTEKGLINQGWKDSHDAISHEDGTLAEAPIALAEIQAYTYAAYRSAAMLARRLEQDALAGSWESRAAALRERFNQTFWMEDEQTFALALDRHKRPCRVVASNAAHCLFAGIADDDKGTLLAQRLMRGDMFSGWGIRTLSARERRYNPMSYHNGSIWPHDVAIAAAGFARYGLVDETARVLTALFEASMAMEGRRLPELFCGFPRQSQHQPVPYPVACRPQAWAAASVFLLLQAVLGLSADACEQRVLFQHSCLPPWLEQLQIRGLAVRDSRVDLCVSRGNWGASVEVLHKSGHLDVVVRK